MNPQRQLRIITLWSSFVNFCTDTNVIDINLNTTFHVGVITITHQLAQRIEIYTGHNIRICQTFHTISLYSKRFRCYSHFHFCNKCIPISLSFFLHSYTGLQVFTQKPLIVSNTTHLFFAIMQE